MWYIFDFPALKESLFFYGMVMAPVLGDNRQCLRDTLSVFVTQPWFLRKASNHSLQADRADSYTGKHFKGLIFLH